MENMWWKVALFSSLLLPLSHVIFWRCRVPPPFTPRSIMPKADADMSVVGRPIRISGHGISISLSLMPLQGKVLHQRNKRLTGKIRDHHKFKSESVKAHPPCAVSALGY